jgi:Domain of unknown function (DUF4333)
MSANFRLLGTAREVPTAHRGFGLRLFALSLAALGVLGCHLDDKKIEESITTEFKSKGVHIKNIDCPSNRPIKSGDEFECEVVDEEGDKLTIKVTQVDGSGNIKWALDGTVLDAEKLGDGIEEELGKGTDVKCPKKATILVKGKEFTCAFTRGDVKGIVEIKVKDNKGNVSWKAKTQD